ncbi:hypothetical protein QN222_20555 [Sinorhizobium sp. 6-70]|uniref:hypothetical protein n=1 Tax=Sinorhizobium sp. 6-70 TaxID=3049088 RepID=UPI0024C3AA8E|nr:hypothetical protein [Sinorhizobium sp. 6-70]MDK1376869.1 hypothetical protein [Sinorhizobium sp. 6-70]
MSVLTDSNLQECDRVAPGRGRDLSLPSARFFFDAPNRKTRASPASAGFPTNFKNGFGKTLA